MKINIVDDWKECWKWLSVNCMVLAGAVQGAWVYIPDDLRQTAPRNLVTIITVGLLVLGILGRLVKQNKETKDAGTTQAAVVDNSQVGGGN